MDTRTGFSYASYTGSLTTFLSGLSLNDWGVILGIIFGFCTFAVNCYYQHKTYKEFQQGKGKNELTHH